MGTPQVTEREKQLLTKIAELENRNDQLQNKLNNILSPSDNTLPLELKDFIDVKEIETMMENFFNLTHIPTAIIDNKGVILVGAGWQTICTRFHRVHPESCRNCIESDTILTSGIPEGEFKLYKCKNGMWDLATPIVVADQYVGNLFMGQFFFDDEPVNYEFFKQQAQHFGFNESEYISALNNVPRLNAQDVDSAKAFFLKIAHSISQLSYNNITLARLLSDLRKSEEQLRKLSRAVEYSPDSIVITDLKGIIEYANPMFSQITGYSLEEAIGKTPRIMKSGKTSPETYKKLWETIKSGRQWRGAFQNKKKSGELFWESVNISPVPDAQGKITHYIAIKEDITKRIEHEQQLYKLNRTLSALRHIADAIIRGDSEQSYLYDICSIIVEDCGHPLVWIGFAENGENKKVHPVAWAGFEEGYIKNLNVSWENNEFGKGPTGTAIRRGTITVCRDMLNDPHFKPWRDEAIKRGYASSVVFPLKQEEKVYGAISIYSREPDAFSGEEVELLSELAEDLSYGLRIIRLRQEHALQEIELKKHKDNLEKLIKVRTHELETANEILTEAQSVSHLGHWQLDLVSGTLIWSDEIYRIFGIEPQSFGATLEAFLNFVHPDDREYVSASYTNSVNDKTLYNIDHRIVRPDGQVRHVHERCLTHYDQNGTPLHSLGIIQDITEQKTIELELEMHKNHLEELIKVRTAELALANRQLQFEIEKEKQVELLLKESLEKERELNEMKSRFISTTSHEFRTPLTSILSSTQLIQRYRHKWNDEKLEEQFNYIKNSIFNLTKLLDDILTISHADSGRIIFNPQLIDLHELCLKIIDEVKHKSGEHHKFQFRFASKEKEFRLDARLIRFTIINLLSNAFKYSPDGGCVTLKVSSTPNQIQLNVSDQGIGIPEEDWQHLFKPFSRAGNTGDIEGTGLGLSIVERAVDLHKGTIKFKSEIGKGTTFTVQIPRG